MHHSFTSIMFSIGIFGLYPIHSSCAVATKKKNIYMPCDAFEVLGWVSNCEIRLFLHHPCLIHVNIASIASGVSWLFSNNETFNFDQFFIVFIDVVDVNSLAPLLKNRM